MAYINGKKIFLAGLNINKIQDIPGTVTTWADLFGLSDGVYNVPKRTTNIIYFPTSIFSEQTEVFGLIEVTNSRLIAYGVHKEITREGKEPTYTYSAVNLSGKGLSTNDYTDADVKWLNTDIPEILTEDYSNIINLSQKINLKEDKVEGKGLSTNDYTDADKAEVAKVANKLDKPANVIEGLLGFNSLGVETIKEITGAGVSVESDPSQIPNNKALKEYVASKSAKHLSKPTSNGIVGYMSGIGSLTYTLNTSMPESPSHAGILSAKAVYDYINGLDASEVSY